MSCWSVWSINDWWSIQLIVSAVTHWSRLQYSRGGVAATVTWSRVFRICVLTDLTLHVESEWAITSLWCCSELWQLWSTGRQCESPIGHNIHWSQHLFTESNLLFSSCFYIFIQINESLFYSNNRPELRQRHSEHNENILRFESEVMDSLATMSSIYSVIDNNH